MNNPHKVGGFRRGDHRHPGDRRSAALLHPALSISPRTAASTYSRTGSEPFVSRLDFAPSLGNAIYSVELVAKNLREAVFEPRNLKAREGMMNAQYIAGQAFNSGGLGIVHSISHAVSAFFRTATTTV